MKKNRRIRKRKKNYFVALLLMAAGSIMLFFVVSGFFIIKQGLSNAPLTTQDDSAQKRQAFIETVAPISQKVAAQSGVLPSIIIGQAILESDFGQSQLAKEYNNLFGIKAAEHESRVLLPTKEFEEDTWLETTAYFKVYANYEEAIADHSQLFVNGVSWDQALYKGVLVARNYQEAAYALQSAGYATDPDYASKIIQVIESYGLASYDS